ncbi:MAG TPA: DUF2171 domain-containing protein [Trichocoleus sp.]|jgi:hypothetical protein
MDISHIKEHLPVYAEGPGGLSGASDVHIGNVDKVENSEYIKLTKHNAIDGEHHWFPVSWIRAVDERAVYLSKTVDEVTEELTVDQPVS